MADKKNDLFKDIIENDDGFSTYQHNDKHSVIKDEKYPDDDEYDYEDFDSDDDEDFYYDEDEDYDEEDKEEY